jgi:hypothetical protein
MANGDLEIVSCKANLLGNEASTVRGRVIRNVYFQGARVLFSTKQYLTGWHSLIRCHAYQGIGEKTKVWVEKNLVPKIIGAKIVQIAADTGCSSICSYEPCINNAWVLDLNIQLKDYPSQVPLDGSIPRQLVLTTTLDILPKSSVEVIVSIPGLTTQFSLSGYEIEADTTGESLQIVSTSQEWTEMDMSNEMQIVMLQTPYA